ncbi:MAG: hypothetical protein FWC62_02025 [Firmicutes bacterium]|nr:hypothetical protein [Bacillota bacterium]
MIKVPISEYPTNRTWDEKSFIAPNIPGGHTGLLTSLRKILTSVKENCPPKQVISFSGSDSKRTLTQLCLILQPSGLVTKTPGGYKISSESERWLESGDDLYLAAFFCANIKFFAEILLNLNTSLMINELQRIAAREYGLVWKTKIPVYNRLVWLRNFGLIRYDEATHKYCLLLKPA